MTSPFHLTILSIGFAMAAPASANASGPHGSSGNELQQVQGIVSTLIRDNQTFMRGKDKAYFQQFSEKQTPRATVVTCSDSRVHTPAMDKTPDNDLFMVRNIGNQLSTAEGSVEYGVRHLNTPLLIFIGHAVCGAVKAASGDYTSLEEPIKKELATIQIPKGIDVTDGVLLNINNQVDHAMNKFKDMTSANKLAVIGAFYDFRNDLGFGFGKLVITNINGETDPAKIKAAVAGGHLIGAPVH
ncbi:carbonic anhydrase [Chitinivorax tropicus]|uniref:carbonic anhydrase n=1 Tax=Chitinivorax tropicus TaxID=714531 RepID=A0A840MRL1_9PROT|nr:carbonic anhydrase [Chitinivorax tropicus]MBB5018873.1 carbonic anhydrase [Chitinivorax tropicus]